MIINVPKPDDFSDVGTSLIFLAWTKTLDLIISFDDPLSPISLQKPRDSRRHFLTAAGIERKVIYTLVLQGVEFLIKARIAHESPFLLLENRALAKASSSDREVPFSDLRTIQASDLVSVNNSIGREIINAQAKQRIDELRNDRNKIVHSIDLTLDIGFKTLIVTILECYSIFMPTEPFFSAYRRYLTDSSKLAKHKFPKNYRRIEYSHFSLAVLLEQAIVVKKQLKSQEFAKYFSCNKKQLRYYCGLCWSYLSSDEHFDQNPSTPIAKERTVYRDKEGRYACYVCGHENKVYPSFKCSKCKGRVLQEGSGFCLNCRQIRMKHI